MDGMEEIWAETEKVMCDLGEVLDRLPGHIPSALQRPELVNLGTKAARCMLFVGAMNGVGPEGEDMRETFQLFHHILGQFLALGWEMREREGF